MATQTSVIRVSRSAWKWICAQCKRKSKEFGRDVTAPEIVDELIKKGNLK